MKRLGAFRCNRIKISAGAYAAPDLERLLNIILRERCHCHVLSNQIGLNLSVEILD